MSDLLKDATILKMLLSFLHQNAHVASFVHAQNAAVYLLGAAFLVICIVVAFAAEWKIFVKANRPGWAAIVPIYNTWTLFEISGKPGWWALFGIVPYIGWLVLLVLYVMAALELARRFGKDAMFAIFGLVVFQIVGFIILGFGDAKYGLPADEKSFHKPTLD